MPKGRGSLCAFPDIVISVERVVWMADIRYLLSVSLPFLNPSRLKAGNSAYLPSGHLEFSNLTP